MPRNCETVSLTFEAQLSKSKVARVRADAALTADAYMGNSQLRLFASADSRQPAADGALTAPRRWSSHSLRMSRTSPRNWLELTLAPTGQRRKRCMCRR